MKEKIFTWFYRTFTFIVPGGYALYIYFLDTLLNKEVTFFQKIGVGGVFTLILMVVIAVHFYGKHFQKAINNVTNQILECLDTTKKAKLIEKKRGLEAKQELFKNACFIAPFIIMWFVCTLIEKEIVSLRGTLFLITVSMAVGFGFSGIAQYLHKKGR